MELLLFWSLLPVVVLLVYIYIKDKYHKEPLLLLLKTLLGGVLSAVAVLLFHEICPLPDAEAVSGELSSALYSAFALAAVPEESCKLLFLYWFIWKNRHFDEYFDGIEYAVCVGLGFAGLENIFYVLDGGVSVAIARALTAVPAHFCFAVAMGYFFALAKFRPRKRHRYMFFAWLSPIILHGIYDFILMFTGLVGNSDATTASLLSLCFIIFFIFLLRLANKRIRKLTHR